MITVTLPFTTVASRDMTRQPALLLHQDIMDWKTAHRVHHQWLISTFDSYENWKVQFLFNNMDDALMFKLTFGGA